MSENQIVTDDPNDVASEDAIRMMIVPVRGVQVMLDRDLAALYGVEVKYLNRQVKRNIERFPSDFMFQLTKEDCLRCQIGTLNGKRGEHLKYMPYAFTENGIAMLSGVLRSSTAIEINIRIMRAFVAMRRVLANVEPLLSRMESVERRQITDQSKNEARFDEIFAKMSAEDIPLQSIFYQNKFWDAKSLLVKFIRRAKKELIVIDAYPGVATLDMLAKRGRGVKVELVTHSNGELEESDFEAFGAQCGKFTKTICGICHDRFIIVDKKEIFWSGASLKDAGRLTFAAAKMGAEVIPGLLESIRNATSSCIVYPIGKRSKNKKV
ncbi:MAG: ORF6N domain-containing protein [Kiritimatiellae bacterium]|nr:ORF6N domain-containing protein [Kiritimatiellia bacterium]